MKDVRVEVGFHDGQIMLLLYSGHLRQKFYESHRNLHLCYEELTFK